MKQFILLILFGLIGFWTIGQEVHIIKMVIINEEGDGAMNLTIVDREKNQDDYFDVVIAKGGLNDFDTIISEKYELIEKSENDILRFYDTEFKFSETMWFHSSNFRISNDSNSFFLTNKNRVTKATTGLKISSNHLKIDLGILVPMGFEITSVIAEPTSIKIDQEKRTVIFSGKEIDNLIYEIEYKKIELDRNYNAAGKKEIIRSRINVEKKKYFLDIWDDKKEDGDIVNIYFNNLLIIENYLVKNEPITIPINLENAKKEKLIIHLESVSEGTIKPNTVFIRFYGDEIDKTINLMTDEKTNSIFLLNINQ